MNHLEAAALGLIQGLTEFLPVSSSGHLVMTQHLLGIGGADHLAFDILLHVATLLAVVVAFRRDLIDMATGIFRDPKQTQLALLLVLAMMPTAAVAYAIKPWFDSALESPAAVGGLLIVTGLVLFGTARVADPTDHLSGVNPRRSLWIGLAQGFAVLPGISRSGVTICAGMLSGLTAEASARFSFLLAILAILAAMTLNIRDVGAISGEGVTVVMTGMIVAFLSGLFSIRWLMRIARRGRFDGFAYYCWIVGGIALLVSLWQRFVVG